MIGSFFATKPTQSLSQAVHFLFGLLLSFTSPAIFAGTYTTYDDDDAVLADAQEAVTLDTTILGSSVVYVDLEGGAFDSVDVSSMSTDQSTAGFAGPTVNIAQDADLGVVSLGTLTGDDEDAPLLNLDSDSYATALPSLASGLDATVEINTDADNPYAVDINLSSLDGLADSTDALAIESMSAAAVIADAGADIAKLGNITIASPSNLSFTVAGVDADATNNAAELANFRTLTLNSGALASIDASELATTEGETPQVVVSGAVTAYGATTGLPLTISNAAISYTATSPAVLPVITGADNSLSIMAGAELGSVTATNLNGITSLVLGSSATAATVGTIVVPATVAVTLAGKVNIGGLMMTANTLTVSSADVSSLPVLYNSDAFDTVVNTAAGGNKLVIALADNTTTAGLPLNDLRSYNHLQISSGLVDTPVDARQMLATSSCEDKPCLELSGGLISADVMMNSGVVKISSDASTTIPNITSGDNKLVVDLGANTNIALGSAQLPEGYNELELVNGTITTDLSVAGSGVNVLLHGGQFDAAQTLTMSAGTVTVDSASTGSQLPSVSAGENTLVVNGSADLSLASIGSGFNLVKLNAAYPNSTIDLTAMATQYLQLPMDGTDLSGTVLRMQAGTVEYKNETAVVSPALATDVTFSSDTQAAIVADPTQANDVLIGSDISDDETYTLSAEFKQLKLNAAIGGATDGGLIFDLTDLSSQPDSKYPRLVLGSDYQSTANSWSARMNGGYVYLEGNHEPPVINGTGDKTLVINTAMSFLTLPLSKLAPFGVIELESGATVKDVDFVFAADSDTASLEKVTRAATDYPSSIQNLTLTVQGAPSSLDLTTAQLGSAFNSLRLGSSSVALVFDEVDMTAMSTPSLIVDRALTTSDAINRLAMQGGQLIMESNASSDAMSRVITALGQGTTTGSTSSGNQLVLTTGMVLDGSDVLQLHHGDSQPFAAAPALSGAARITNSEIYLHQGAPYPLSLGNTTTAAGANSLVAAGIEADLDISTQSADYDEIIVIAPGAKTVTAGNLQSIVLESDVPSDAIVLGAGADNAVSTLLITGQDLSLPSISKEQSSQPQDLAFGTTARNISMDIELGDATAFAQMNLGTVSHAHLYNSRVIFKPGATATSWNFANAFAGGENTIVVQGASLDGQSVLSLPAGVNALSFTAGVLPNVNVVHVDTNISLEGLGGANQVGNVDFQATGASLRLQGDTFSSQNTLGLLIAEAPTTLQLDFSAYDQYLLTLKKPYNWQITGTEQEEVDCVDVHVNGLIGRYFCMTKANALANFEAGTVLMPRKLNSRLHMLDVMPENVLIPHNLYIARAESKSKNRPRLSYYEQGFAYLGRYDEFRWLVDAGYRHTRAGSSIQVDEYALAALMDRMSSRTWSVQANAELGYNISRRAVYQQYAEQKYPRSSYLHAELGAGLKWQESFNDRDFMLMSRLYTALRFTPTHQEWLYKMNSRTQWLLMPEVVLSLRSGLFDLPQHQHISLGYDLQLAGSEQKYTIMGAEHTFKKARRALDHAYAGYDVQFAVNSRLEMDVFANLYGDKSYSFGLRLGMRTRPLHHWGRSGFFASRKP